ncbi:TIGR02680 family protein [Ktedonobacter sp. SOSP1-52]|uniref:SbcC/MukB-like Walker B domain-containing protein n=1 Tax=Ktedonobacter sp. SOSP1-52 TaxID=2778366 RepID=UPI001916159D|nr:SbcC/MukB-like Walker B domain-containing protein [Ktedonobacter sp. SOSP1-52]GHO65123.1 TIGR02680 family protein [Ktedonobacter sp. SOSP1-52]
MQETFDQLTEWTATLDETSEDALTRQVTRFVETLQAQTGGPEGYRLRRIILTNFWLYGRQEFEVPHGRLFLAGENASGKSTVLTAALPLALEGDLRPNRLDTFGGRERRIEYYVLGDSNSATPYQHERRTAYIALEFEWCDPNRPPIADELRQRWENGDRERTRFLTIGLSIAGNANTTERIRALRFLITDGSRLGYDLDTIYESKNNGEKRAYDHLRFKQLLEGHGIICETQAEYERQVARHLFGFHDSKDFEKLINLLLILRRPNLSTELNFSRVHDYLKMSLRKISSETTSRVIGTIERIDSIQSEIERVQEAYAAAERIHQSLQHLASIRAQLAACEYQGAQFVEDVAQNRATSLRRSLAHAEKERTEAGQRSQSLQEEQQHIHGQIRALEASEGLQVATQLAAVRERLQSATSQMKLQQQSLDAARHASNASEQSIQRQQTRFGRMKDECLAQLRTLHTLAAEKALWETAAIQLEGAIAQVNTFATHTSSMPEVPSGITTLLGAPAEERIAWLHRLEALHQQRAQLDNKVQNARQIEMTRFQELDEVRSHLQALQDRSWQAQQQIEQDLDTFSLEERDAPDSAFAPEELDATLENDNTQEGTLVERCSALLKHYRQTIESLEHELSEACAEVQDEMHELHLLIGGKTHELQELKALIERKKAEPEYQPVSAERHMRARARLAEQSIDALPLYMLLDFAPGSDELEAGCIETALEDAGLLNALVVQPSQQAAAAVLLASEELSDCWLDLRRLQPHPRAPQARDILCFDTALQAPAGRWETLTIDIIAALLASDIYSMESSGQWIHGLLSGHAGPGQARYIGRKTRLRTRQRELEALESQQAQLEEEYQWFTSLLFAYEQQLEQLQEKQAQLRKVLPQSGLEEIYLELVQTQKTLNTARDRYQKARQHTQEARQSYNAIIAQLERESQGVALLVSDQHRVQATLISVIELKNQASSLQTHFQSLVHSWEEYQQASVAREQAQANEANSQRLYEHVRQQVLRARAEMEEFERVASLANAEELSERLRMLRERDDILASELDEARQKHARTDERYQNVAANLVEIEAHLQEAQEERAQRQARFLDLLTAYPVEALLAAKQDDALTAARILLNGALSESEIPQRKERLENEYRDAYNALARSFNQEQSLLLEYGPDLDDQGRVHFLNENRSRPIELLAILSERIEMQRTLLGEEERQLFEDFLLQEIAEAIRMHILEAEEWVQQINRVLSNLPMIGEHYSLQWKPPAEYDLTRLGSQLAQQHRLLRKPAQALTAEESDALMSAFRREIEAVRLRQQEAPDLNFMEALEQIFDYREWFHFDVWVTPIGGQRQRLTDRLAGTRSGAEQLFALYVPLFAALGALYNSASPGAPRLLALDEAFDKVSASNTQRIMEFLVSQGFQWIMTGPEVSGVGAKIPASARYLMIHDKGSSVATASASFWSEKTGMQAE